MGSILAENFTGIFKPSPRLFLFYYFMSVICQRLCGSKRRGTLIEQSAGGPVEARNRCWPRRKTKGIRAWHRIAKRTHLYI